MSEDIYATPFFVALYGTYRPAFPDADEDELERDPLWLFNEISHAMRWLDTRRIHISENGPPRQVGTAGLWNTNDAGLGSPLHHDGSPDPAIWFSAALSPVPAEEPLPIQPFLTAARETVQRLGSFELTSAQFAIPARPSGQRHEPRSLAAGRLLREIPGDDQGTAIHIEVASGTTGAFDDDALERLTTAALETTLDYFHITASPRPLTTPVVVPVSDAVWDGPCASAMSFECEIGEWTFESVGWLVAHLSELLTVNEVSTAVAINISRAAAGAED